MGNGLTIQAAYTWSHETGMCCSETGAPAILIPQYQRLNWATMPLDVTHNFHLATAYELPLGKGKQFVKSGPLSWIVGGWSTHALFTQVSGLPFSVTSSNASLNAPGSTQRANQLTPKVGIVGSGLNGQPYFDPLAFAPVTTASFGTAGFSTLRGPHNRNLDFSVYRTFALPFQAERFRLQFRAEVFNISNTPHFNPPTTGACSGGACSANVSNLSLNGDGSIKALNGYDQITAVNPLGRLIDPRYFRFSLRLMW
jgi:hypothetical protein